MFLHTERWKDGFDNSAHQVIVKQGIASEAELDELDHAVREHLADPDTLVVPFMYFMVWGRKPGGSP